jgi:hypothetical protein
MTSDRRIKANRKNAMRSTGPKSEGGKRRVSQNARRHGLTTPPDKDAVVSWIEIILDDPALDGHDLPLAEMSLVTSLADAEARLDRVRETEFRFLEDYHVLDRSAAHLERVYRQSEIHRRTLKRGPSFTYAGERFAGLMEPDKEWVEFREEIKRKTYASELRRLFRYRRETECQRERALKAWIGHLKTLQDSKTKPSMATADASDSKSKP